MFVYTPLQKQDDEMITRILLILSGLATVIHAQEWEQNILTIPSPDSCRSYLYRLTEEPHVAGTEEDYAVATFLLNKFRSFGLDARIESYDVYLPYPREVRIELQRPVTYEGPTPEQGFPEDKDSYASNIISGFNAYSPSGFVQGQAVYVNYGRPEDYAVLKRYGIEVRGKIAVARYGKNFRGVKAKVAEEHGAAGLLIYSDPADDGYMRGDPFPRGPFRPEFGVQRGSIQYLFIYPGDPLTPGTAATSTARRLAPEEATNLPHIPTAPLSYGDARLILRNLAGANVPEGWQGGLPFAYHLGPGPSEVSLHLDMDYQIRPIRNVIAKIPGATYPDEVVVIGNHHDAWTYGAVDPSSGTSTVLETARAFSELVKQGYRPARTIIFACWDAEEYGLIGSTEWVEQHKDELLKNCVAYINIDVAVAGADFDAAATPILKPFIQSAIQKVPDPKTGEPILAHVWKRKNKDKKPKPPVPDFAAADSLIVDFNDLGSGSDYTAFFDFAGIPSLSMHFGGPYGVYHSTYDNFYWMAHFGDPTFAYHATMAKIAALMVHELANREILPYALPQYAKEMQRHAEKIEKAWQEAEQPAESSMDAIIEKCIAWAEIARQWQANGVAGPQLSPSRLNEILMRIERAFIDPKGLPDRTWYKHLLFAPGYYLGYGAQAFPGVQYFAAKQEWERVNEEIFRISLALDAAIAHTRELLAAVRAAPNENE